MGARMRERGLLMEYYTPEQRAEILAMLTTLAQGVNPDFYAIYSDVHKLWAIVHSPNDTIAEMQKYLPDILGYLWGEMRGKRTDEWLRVFGECNQMVAEKWRR